MQQVAQVLQRAFSDDRHHAHGVGVQHRRQVGGDPHECAVDLAPHDPDGDLLRGGRPGGAGGRGEQGGWDARQQGAAMHCYLTDSASRSGPASASPMVKAR